MLSQLAVVKTSLCDKPCENSEAWNGSFDFNLWKGLVTSWYFLVQVLNEEITCTEVLSLESS